MPRTLRSRLRGILAELFKFAVVGGFCFVLDTGLAYVFRFRLGSHNLGPTTSKGLSTIIATGVSYLGNRLWSFRHRVDDEASHGKDLTVYAAINGVGLVITLIPVVISHYLLHQTSPLAFTIAGTIGTGVATFFRFWGYRRWVFAADPDLAERAALV